MLYEKNEQSFAAECDLHDAAMCFVYDLGRTNVKFLMENLKDVPTDSDAIRHLKAALILRGEKQLDPIRNSERKKAVRPSTIPRELRDWAANRERLGLDASLLRAAAAEIELTAD